MSALQYYCTDPVKFESDKEETVQDVSTFATPATVSDKTPVISDKGLDSTDKTGTDISDKMVHKNQPMLT